MACEYFVGGKWVTESQFKEILNNGLLDNLVANGDVSLKGYKPDSSKVIKRETKTITNDKVPANKLANILANEIKTRAGYPINMLSALELNADGTDFKIPLWASPYARKFESLLTSLVSNKVVKQKLPGTSSVLGSEEGFKVKEGDEAAGDLDKSGIVFTESFDPVKGLQPMRLDPVTKKILPDQVIMPWKFRTESGEILNLDEFTVRTEDGKLMLDTTKVPKDILNTFGFRIPTQKQNSMAGIEIVGFLPEAMGDLLLAPRDFTKRMGSDFDVDKLYQYFYNIFHQDGKLYNNFLSDPEAIEKAKEATIKQIEELKDSLKFTKEERKLVDNYIKQNLERTENNEEPEVAQKASDLIRQSISQADRLALDTAFERLSILNRSYVASRQNNIVKTHLRIANSSNPEIIKMFLGTDSPGEFKELSTQVEKIRKERGLIAPIVTILSDTYQRTKYINATAGKDAVGNFSLDSTFNTIVQGKDLILIELTPGTEADVYGTLENPRTPTKEDFLTYNIPLAIFGNIESKGDISNKYTLRSQAIINKAKQEKRDLTDAEKKSLKYKSEVIRTVQSSALDNEKEQILDKLNINNQTFDAIRALSLLGFEEKDIAGLISQEIIWEYVDALKDANSSLTPYNPNAEEEITNMLIAKYDPQGKFIGLSREMLTKYQSQSGEQLMDNIANQTLKPLESGETPDYNLQQLAILEKFKSLSAHGKTIKQLQSTVNTASKGLPKSLIEVNAKVEQVSKLPLVQVFNSEKLLGQYANTQLIKPEGINGYATYYGTLFADRIFNDYFPYKTQGFQTAVAEILTHTPKGADVSINKKAETQAEVFEDVKSYLYGNPDTNLFSGDPTLERKRLFIDSRDNKSLATVLNTLSSQPWFQKNGFLNKLSFDLNKNGQISRINFEAAAGENFDERAIYDGFVYLLTKNFPVGTFNGRDYTSRTLAQELIAAAFLEGGNQGAKQYLKYVPISYLKVLGFGDYLQKVPFDFRATFYGNLSDYGPIYNQPSSFTRQYFQNNPDKTKTVTLSDLKGNENKTPKEYFTLNEEALINNFVDVIDPATGDSTQMQTQFLSIYDTKEPSKYALYEFDSIDRNYKRIPVLAGSYGFVGYNSTPNISMPVEKTNINTTPKINATAPGYNITNIPVAPTKSFDINVVNNTAEPELTAGMPISKALSNTKEALDDILNNLETAEGVSTLNKQLMMLFRELELPKGFNVKYVTNGKGQYNYADSSLLLNLNHKDHTTVDGLATTVLHELTHAFTGEAIKKYERGDIDLTPSQIAAIQNLEKLQRLYINSLTEQGEAGSLAEFKAKYEAYAASDKTKSPGISKEDISKYYGAIKLSEFVTMALTDVEFQKRLNNIKTEDGKTIWEQIKDALFNLLNTLGLDIKPGSALATSVKDTFDLIEANQDALKANNITTETFVEHGTKYKFEINGNGEVIKAEYSQGMSSVYNPMNPKNAQKKYDSLKAGITTQSSTSVKPTIDLSKEWSGDLKTRLVYTAEGVNTMRTEAAKPNEHFGNPFSEAGYGGTIKVPSIGAAVIAYKEWLLGTNHKDVKPQQREWILDQINQGKLDGATLLYAGKLEARGQGMHPTALAEVVEQLRSNRPSTQPSTTLPGPDTKINIYAGTGENAELSNFAARPFNYNGIKFPTVEHAFQYAKGKYYNTYEIDPSSNITPDQLQDKVDEHLKNILNAATGAEAKKLGRKNIGVGFENSFWDTDSSDIMKDLLLKSFKQNPDALAKLLATGNATLTHTQDKGKWGTEFPKLLMEVRDKLRGTQPSIQPTEVEENKFDYQGKSIKTAFPLTTGQEQALESLVDFVRQDDEKTITLQGAAGTGKTAVIGYLQKYFGGTGINFVYLAPTHAATAELAFATVKSGNKELPMTVQSAVSDRIDNKTQTRKISFTKKLENKLGYVGNIIVVDEVSMLSAKDYLALNKAIENKDVKIVFMGDILQIPEVNVANPEIKQVSLAFSQPRQLNLTEVKRTESDAILEVLGTLRKNTQPQIPVIPNTEEIKYLSGTEYNRELVDTLRKEPEDTLVISYTNAGVTATNTKIREVLGRTGDLQENDIIVGYLGYSSKQIEKGNIANSIRYTVQDVQKVGSAYKIIATSKKLKALKDAGVSVSEIATGNYLQLNDGDAFKFSDLTQEDFDKNNREISNVMKKLYNAKKAALQNPRLWPDYYSTEGETSKFFSVNSVGDNYIYNPTTDKMEKYSSLVHKDLRRSFPELYVEKGIDLGHAITIHKSQGSTVRNVFFDADTLPKGTSSKLFKNSDQIGNEKHSLIYVAMSRASNKLVVNNNQMSNFYTLRGAPFNLSALGNIESLREMPIDTESESNQPSQDDLEAYYRSLGEDQSLETSPINPKEFEKYLLICGK
jgi:predicted NAD-dependent protein-ADP-ribosyltransferase YbiA (DUF1768 family)